MLFEPHPHLAFVVICVFITGVCGWQLRRDPRFRHPSAFRYLALFVVGWWTLAAAIGDDHSLSWPMALAGAGASLGTGALGYSLARSGEGRAVRTAIALVLLAVGAGLVYLVMAPSV